MGKIKHERQKFHITPIENKEKASSKQKNVSKYKPVPLKLDAVENMFAGINIQLDSLNKLNDDNPPPVVQSIKDDKESIKPESEEATTTTANKIPLKIKSDAPEKHLTKKEKRVMKHAKLMEKIGFFEQQRRSTTRSQKKKNQKNEINQSILPSPIEIKSLIAPAAVKLAQNTAIVDGEKVAKNVFAVPTFNDDLPALDSIFKVTAATSKLSQSSKTSKAKNKNKKQNFVKNYNLLKKLMANKKKY